MRIKRIVGVCIGAGIAIAGTVAGIVAPGSASADDGSCTPVSIVNGAGKFNGWKCQDDSGTAVGGQLRDTNGTDGRCVVLAVTFVNDGTLVTQPACYGDWPRWVGQASDYDVISIEVRTV